MIRHWLGRCPGQDQKLYQTLTTARGYTAAQAKIVMQLLFGFYRGRAIQVPETYEVLIDYLAHEKPGIRNLAAWHQVRLVPQGKAIPVQAQRDRGRRGEGAGSLEETCFPRESFHQNAPEEVD